MATYLRFTETAEEDIEKGYSYLKTPSMKKAKKQLLLVTYYRLIQCELSNLVSTWIDFRRSVKFQQISTVLA